MLLIVVVALVVLPPSKWPMVLYHLAKVIRTCQNIKETLYEFCKNHIQIYELEVNQERANQVDKIYQSAEKSATSNKTEQSR